MDRPGKPADEDTPVPDCSWLISPLTPLQGWWQALCSWWQPGFRRATRTEWRLIQRHAAAVLTHRRELAQVLEHQANAIDQWQARVWDLERTLEERDLAIADLKLRVRLLEADALVNEESIKTMTLVINRDRLRVEAETAVFAERVARAEK